MRWKKAGRRLYLACLIPIVANLPLWIYKGAAGLSTVWMTVAALVISWAWIKWNILPYKDREGLPARLVIMRGGHVLGCGAIYGFAAQLMILAASYGRGICPPHIWMIDAVYSVLVLLLLLWNGILRMFFTSARLRIRTRLLMLLAMWIPAVNLFVLLHAMKLVAAEYDFACYKEAVRTIRTESDLCRTRYPLIMVHGVGFRDLKYFNYWGRVPKELTRYGATVFYGNQEAFGTIIYNAEDIRKKILEVVKETGCEKVNIIAHSKGGLDSRYAISCLGMAPCTASLTTICTPHHGCRFVDYACRLPEGFYRLVSRHFDRVFSKFGDKNPDFYTATHQFSTESSRQFNEQVPDAPGVYYQSYASVMHNCFSDPLLWIPYCLIKPLEGDNDGLVSIPSARWGEFKETFVSRGHRGISHGDMIDLKREDYKGFDVVECYVKIVSELAKKGF